MQLLTGIRIKDGTPVIVGLTGINWPIRPTPGLPDGKPPALKVPGRSSRMDTVSIRLLVNEVTVLAPKNLGDKSEAIRILREETIGRLGTFYGNFPYVVPLCYVYHREAIYFHSGLTGQKLAGIRKNNRVCFQVDRVLGVRRSPSPCQYDLHYRSVIVFGRAEEVSTYEEKLSALNALSAVFARGSPLEPMREELINRTVVVKILIEHMTTKLKLG